MNSDVFHAGTVADSARQLLGWQLRVGDCVGRIVETEAYGSSDDAASHAFRGQTPRSEIMFGPPGRLYVYLIYGMYWCANLVCRPSGEAGAVLIRAIEPLAGLDEMQARRPASAAPAVLGAGPGKLCQALDITGDDNGVEVFSPDARVQLIAPTHPIDGGHIVTGERIGITKAVERRWRFGLIDSPSLSRPFSS